MCHYERVIVTMFIHIFFCNILHTLLFRQNDFDYDVMMMIIIIDVMI